MAKDTRNTSGNATSAVTDALQGMGERASEALQDAAHQAREAVEEAVEEVRERVASIEDAIEEITTEHPKTMLGLAVVAGFVLGALYWSGRERY